MPKITIRYQQVRDAKRLFEILMNPNFLYFHASAKSVQDEREWLKKNPQKRKDNFEWNYAVLYGDKLVGAVGIKINQHRKYIGEIGYFLDEAYWGKGITTKAVALLEKEAFKKIGLRRIEILMRPENKASEKVAVKNSYQKEGLLKKYIKERDGKMYDCLIYSKVL